MLRLASFTGSGTVASTGLVFKNTYSDTSTLHTYTFSSVDIGTANANRVVIAILFRNKCSSLPSGTSCTIGGISATLETGNSSTKAGVFMYSANVTSGSTADIVFTVAGGTVTADGVFLAVYAGIPNTAATHTSNNNAFGTTLPLALTTAISAKSIFGSVSVVNTWTPAWSEATETVQTRGSGVFTGSSNSISYIFGDIAHTVASAPGSFDPTPSNAADGEDRNCIACWF